MNGWARIAAPCFGRCGQGESTFSNGIVDSAGSGTRWVDFLPVGRVFTRGLAGLGDGCETIVGCSSRVARSFVGGWNEARAASLASVLISQAIGGFEHDWQNDNDALSQVGACWNDTLAVAGIEPCISSYIAHWNEQDYYYDIDIGRMLGGLSIPTILKFEVHLLCIVHGTQHAFLPFTLLSVARYCTWYFSTELFLLSEYTMSYAVVWFVVQRQEHAYPEFYAPTIVVTGT